MRILKSFKLFALDIGLFGNIPVLQPHALLDGSNVFIVFNKVLILQPVLRGITANRGLNIF